MLTRVPWGQYEGAFCARITRLEDDPTAHGCRVAEETPTAVPFVWLDLDDVATADARAFAEALAEVRAWSGVLIHRRLGALDLPMFTRHLLLDATPVLGQEYSALAEFTAQLAEYHPRPRKDTVQEVVVRSPHPANLRTDIFDVLPAVLGPDAMLTCYVPSEHMRQAEAALAVCSAPWMVRLDVGHGAP